LQLRIPRLRKDPKQAFFRSYRSILPISLTYRDSIRLRLLTLGTPVSVLGTGWRFAPKRFFIGIWTCLKPPTIRQLFMLSSGSRRKGTPQSYTFKQERQSCMSYPHPSPLWLTLPHTTLQVQKYKSVSLSLPTVTKKLRPD
jgi:hypothetical protein